MDPNTMKKRRTLAGTRTTATTSTTATTATTTAAAAAAATTQPNTTRVSSFTRQHDPTTTASSVAPPTRSQFETSTPHATATAAVAAEVKATAREDQKPESEATAAGTSNSNTTVPPYDSSYSLEVLKDLPGLRSRVRRHVHSVIQCLPPSQTLAYREAMRRDASLVDTETDPLQFVRYCKYDIGQGARRLCAYWTERLKLFSPKRAFLPLTLTGTGALTEQDIDTLRAGYPSLIESTNHNNNNNNNNNNNSSGTFMLIDRRRKMASTTTDQILRAMFYCMAILAADPMSQWEGARLVVMSVSPRSHNVDFSLIHRGASLNATCFPVWPKLYLVGIPLAKRPTFSQGLIKAMVFLLRQYFQTEIYICLQETTTNHNNKGDPNNNPSNNNNNANSILEQLLALGFDRNDIPQSFGGYWSFDRFGQWLRERQQMEYENYKDRLLKKPPTAATAATTTSTSSDDGAAAGIHDPSTKDHHVATTSGNASLVPPAYSNAFGYSGAFSPNLMGGGGGNGFGGGAAAGFAALSASSSSNFPSMTTPTAQTAPTVATDIFALASSSLAPPAVLWPHPPQPPPNRLHPTTVAAGLPAAMTRGSAGPAMSSSATLHARAATAAAAVAPNPEGDDEEEERLSKKRMSNLLASRKVRERFCNRLQTLQEQKSSLTKEQERLQVEHDKLTRLCHQAEYTVRTILHLDDPEDLDNDDDHDDDDDNCDNHDDDNNNVSEN
ncbi:hypothetical protein ACA910_002158 [Epithemia clementina (nom. ined.)]